MRCAAPVALLVLGSPSRAAADPLVLTPGSTISQMATCDAVGKVPLLFASIFVGVRGIADGFSRSLLRTRREENLYLVTAGTASFAHMLCGPAVHFGHENYTKGFQSLGLRTGLPLAAFALTYGVHALTAEPGDVFGKTSTSVIFGSISVGAAILAGFALDYTVLARLPATKATSKTNVTTGWAPTVFPTERGVALGVFGAL